MLNKLRGETFFKSFFQLAMGSIIAQIIVIVISPFITRVYSVSEMGEYALLLTIISIFGAVINGKYDSAIVSTNDEKDVSKLIVTAICFSIVIISVIIFGLYTFFIINPSKYSLDVSILFYVAILLFLTGITNILIAYNNRKKEYGLISRIYVVRTTFQNILLLIFGLLKFGIVGMILSQVIGIFFGIRKQYKSLKDDNLNYKLSKKELCSVSKKYKEFPRYSLPATLANSLSYSILNFFITYLFGLITLGYYSMTFRILGLPLSLVSANISKVFFRDASEEMKEKGNFLISLKKSTLFLLVIAIPMVVVLVVFSPTLFAFVFGSDWRTAGEYARILSPMFGIRLVVSALTPGFMVAKKQNIELIFQILFLTSSILTFVLSLIFGFDIKLFLLIYSIINSIVYILLYLKIFSLGRGDRND